MVRAGRSVAGLMPITASPHPSSSPSMIEAVTPTGSSVGWLGCSRVASVPGCPMVLRKALTTGVRRPTAIRSWIRISFDTAATISGVSPGASAVVSTSSSQQVVAEPADGQRGDRGERRCVVRVDDQPGDLVGLVRHDLLLAGTCPAAGRPGAVWAATRSCSDAAATPASWSPDRAGVAAASSAARSPNRWLCPPTVVWRTVISAPSPPLPVPRTPRPVPRRPGGAGCRGRSRP